MRRRQTGDCSGICTELLRIATQRERAYQAAQYLKGAKLAAISSLRRKAAFYKKSSMNTTDLLRLVRSELCTLLPSARSRYRQLRKKMQELINAATVD